MPGRGAKARRRAAREATKGSPRKVWHPPSFEDAMAALGKIPRTQITTPELQSVMGGVHEATVWRWVSEGEIPAKKIRQRGRANIYLKKDVEAFLKKRFAPA